MEKVFDKYPNTIGEELKCQIEYKKMQDKNFNYSEFSRQIRDKFMEDLDYKRKDDDNFSTRPASINELLEVGRKEKTPKYMYLLMAFKSLEIIKDDIVILQMLKDYEILPKKNKDKDDLEKIKQKLDVGTNIVLRKDFYNGINICTKCKEKFIPCGNTYKCINIKIHEHLKNLSVNEQINYLYSLGLPTTFKEAPVVYRISIQTLKSLVEKLNMLDLKNEIEKIENHYINKPIYEDKFKEEQNHLKESIKRKRNNIKDLKKLQHTSINKKKEELQYDIEIEQQKLEYYKDRYEHIKNNKNVNNKNKQYESMLRKELQKLLYGN